MEQPLWVVGAVLAAAFAIGGLVVIARDQQWRRRKGRVVLVLPSVEETRQAISSFQAAVRRDELIEFVWRKLGPAGLAARAGHPRHRG